MFCRKFISGGCEILPRPNLVKGEVSDEQGLARRIGFFSLVIYGVGDMVGAGIYGTVGVAAGVMGNAVWMAFFVSMVAAMLTGLSYASLASRYPRAAGAAYITHRAYGWPLLSYVVGLAVAVSGMTSMAAGSNIFAQTLHAVFPEWPVPLLIGGFILALTVLNLAGIKESLRANLLCTTVEVGGLVFVIVTGLRFWGSVNYLELPQGENFSVAVLLSGAVLTFFAFIGFEDMLNVAEEVKEPRWMMPWGIVSALFIVALLYIGVSVTAVSVVPASRLADSSQGAPLAQIAGVSAPWLPGWIYPAFTLFAVVNTALLNFIMASRVLYGMARQGLLPGVLGRVHRRRQTPHFAILALAILVTTLAFSGNILQLASATSLLLLSCFVVVNAALVLLRNRAGEPRGAMEVPVWVPVLGVLVCGVLVISRIFFGGGEMRAPLIAGVLVLGFILTYFFVKPRHGYLMSRDA